MVISERRYEPQRIRTYSQSSFGLALVNGIQLREDLKKWINVVSERLLMPVVGQNAHFVPSTYSSSKICPFPSFNVKIRWRHSDIYRKNFHILC